MILALNGILIVAMTLAVGMAWMSKWLVAAAFAMAGLSYLVNIIDSWAEEGTEGLDGVRGFLFLVTFVIGVVAYVYIALRLFF